MGCVYSVDVHDPMESYWKQWNSNNNKKLSNPRNVRFEKFMHEFGKMKYFEILNRLSRKEKSAKIYKKLVPYTQW